MYAVIKTGGKQYRVAANDVIEIEKIAGDPGTVVRFAEVLMLGGETSPQIGTPTIAGASVAGEVLEQTRGDKVIIFKKRRRHNYRRKKGHRQEVTRVRIAEILTGGAEPSKSAGPSGARAAASSDTTPAGFGRPFALLTEPDGAPDDLTRISGVGATINSVLHDHGIYHYWQIAAMSPEDVAKLEKDFDFPGRVGREQWIAQARELMAGAMPRAQIDRAGWEAKQSGRFMRLAGPQGKPDDLSLIGGVGPKIERTLHQSGIFHFWQVAALGPEDIARLEADIRFPGRIAREEWIEQAKELMAGKRPRAKIDRKHQDDSKKS